MEGRLTFWGRLLALAIGFVFIVGLAEVAARVIYPQWRDFYSGRFLDTTMVDGHGKLRIGRPSFEGYFAQNNGDFRVHIKINAFGLRNGEPVQAADGRIWIVGDSLTFGWGVEQEEMYSAVIGQITGTPTYNLASPSTNVCGYQAMVTRMPKNTRPLAVIVGLVMEGDIKEYDCRAAAKDNLSRSLKEAGSRDFNLVRLKLLLTGHSALYNFSATTLKRIGFVVKALMAVGLVKPEHVNKPTFDRTRIGALVEKTADELSRLRGLLGANTPFAVLIAPARFDVREQDPVYGGLRQAMIKDLKARGIAVIDPYQELKSAGFNATHFEHDGHWSALGHKIAGKVAAIWIRSQLLAN